MQPAPRRRRSSPRAARGALALGATTALVLLTLLALHLSRPSSPNEPTARLRVASALAAGDPAGFSRALAPRTFSFPADYGAHPGFRTEWWYWTGHLAAGHGRRFGFQLTLFRFAVAPEDAVPARESAWATRQVWMAHFALTEIGGTAGGRFRAWERLARGAVGLAGAERGDTVAGTPYRVWVDGWEARGGAPGAFLPLHLHAAVEDAALDLTLTSAKAPVLQGDRGLSQKGPEPGNASYYVSLTHMPTAGTLTLAGEALSVHGLAWMDREWSTDALPAGVVGWDWFALQLDDGRSLMLYRLRHGDGSASRFSSGSLVAAGGAVRPLAADTFSIVDLAHWRSPGSGVVYPSRWRLWIPGEGLDLTVVPQLPDQELDLSFRYWEGAVAVSGTSFGKAISGQGYAELTGYGDAAPPGAGRGRS